MQRTLGLLARWPARLPAGFAGLPAGVAHPTNWPTRISGLVSQMTGRFRDV
jgi:hypothetical protein